MAAFKYVYYDKDTERLFRDDGSNIYFVDSGGAKCNEKFFQDNPTRFFLLNAYELQADTPEWTHGQIFVNRWDDTDSYFPWTVYNGCDFVTTADIAVPGWFTQVTYQDYYLG